MFHGGNERREKHGGVKDKSYRIVTATFIALRIRIGYMKTLVPVEHQRWRTIALKIGLAAEDDCSISCED